MNHSELSVETEKHLAQLTETSRMSTRKWVLRTMTCGPSVRSGLSDSSRNFLQELRTAEEI